MKCNNSLTDYLKENNQVTLESKNLLIKTFLTLLYPLAPHISSELLEITLGEKIFLEWPKVDERYSIQKTFELVVQVNGKKKAAKEVNNVPYIAVKAPYSSVTGFHAEVKRKPSPYLFIDSVD